MLLSRRLANDREQLHLNFTSISVQPQFRLTSTLSCFDFDLTERRSSKAIIGIDSSVRDGMLLSLVAYVNFIVSDSIWKEVGRLEQKFVNMNRSVNRWLLSESMRGAKEEEGCAILLAMHFDFTRMRLGS